MNKIDAPNWFFMWKRLGSVDLRLHGETKKEAIKVCEEHFGIPWKKLYGRGGRLVRCEVTLKK